MSLWTMFESVGTLKRPTTGEDDSGGVTKDPFKVIADSIPCSVQEAGADVIELYNQPNAQVTTTIFCERDINAQVEDRFEVVHNRTRKVHVFLVRGFPKGILNRPLAPYALHAQEIQ